MAKKAKRRKPVWHRLSRKKQDLYLEVLWQDGFTEQAIADFLSTTKGTIVGRRARIQLDNEGRGSIKREVVTDRFYDLLQLRDMRAIEEESGGTVVCIGPVDSSPEESGLIALEEDTSLRSAHARSQKSPATPVNTCQWPLLEGGSLKEPKLCGDPTACGESLCEKHREIARRLARQR